MRAYGIRLSDQWGVSHRRDQKSEGRRFRGAHEPARHLKRRARFSARSEVEDQLLHAITPQEMRLIGCECADCKWRWSTDYEFLEFIAGRTDVTFTSG